jgi:hypothetical protein
LWPLARPQFYSFPPALQQQGVRGNKTLPPAKAAFMEWAVRLVVAAFILCLAGLASSLEISARNHEELVAGIKNPQVSGIVLEQDISLLVDEWQGKLSV